MKSMPVVGQVWPDADAAKCVPGEASMNTILRHDTEEEPVTYPYDTCPDYFLFHTDSGAPKMVIKSTVVTGSHNRQKMSSDR